MRQRNLSKGIAASKQGRKFLKDKARSLADMMGQDAMGWNDLPMIAKMFYQNPGQAIKALRKGSALYRETAIETFVLCAFIHGELESRKKQIKIIKKDPNYISLNRIIDDQLYDLCACINIDYNKIIPSKRHQRLYPKTLGKKDPGQTMPRQPIIDRCIERYRRLAIRDKRKFLTWYKKQNFPKQK